MKIVEKLHKPGQLAAIGVGLMLSSVAAAYLIGVGEPVNFYIFATYLFIMFIGVGIVIIAGDLQIVEDIRGKRR